MNSAEGGGTFEGICGSCKIQCGYKRKVYLKKKARGNGGKSGGRSVRGGNGKYYNHCKTAGHEKDNDWKLHSELVPQWYKDMNAKNNDEAALSSVEMILAQVNESEPQEFSVACL